jgi:exonuclease III
MFRILSLNVTNGGGAYSNSFLANIKDHQPDLITLQEMRGDTVGRWRAQLEAENYHVADTFDLARKHGIDHSSRFRHDGLLVASRWPIRELNPLRWNLPWPERALSVIVKHLETAFELHTAHVPNASTGIKLYNKTDKVLGRERLLKKIETFEGIYQGLGRSSMPKILAGDFNTPHRELPDGTVGYWQHSCPAGLRDELQARWLTAERNIIQGLAAFSMYDAFRERHGYGYSGKSWVHSSNSSYRYDHIFASTAFMVHECDYLQEFRKTSSHHAGVFADLSFTGEVFA